MSFVVLESLENFGDTWRMPNYPGVRSGDDLETWIDSENFGPWYVMRRMHLLRKRGNKPQWPHSQKYWAEKNQTPASELSDCPFHAE